MIVQLRSLHKEELPDGVTKFVVSLHQLATDPRVLQAFAEGHIAGGTVNIDGKDFRVIQVQPVDNFSFEETRGGCVYFSVSVMNEVDAAATESASRLQVAVGIYESKVRLAAKELIKFCVANKISPEVVDKFYGEEVK